MVVEAHLLSPLCQYVERFAMARYWRVRSSRCLLALVLAGCVTTSVTPDSDHKGDGMHRTWTEAHGGMNAQD